MLCEIVDCWVVPKTSLNPLGEVIAGALTLKGRLRRAVVSQRHIYDGENGQTLGSFLVDNMSDHTPVSEAWCIPLLHNEYDRFVCLALRRTTDEETSGRNYQGRLEKNVFKRIGLIESAWRDPKPGDRDISNHVVGTDAVACAATENRSSIRDLLDWFEGAHQEVIRLSNVSGFTALVVTYL